MIVGVKTERWTKVVNGHRFYLEQEWFLHSTKGWKRGAKRKYYKEITYNNKWPRETHEIQWSK